MRFKEIERITVLCRLLTDTQEPSEKRSNAIASTWYFLLEEIPASRLYPVFLAAAAIGPKLHVFGPWDLLTVWRENLRGPNGKQVRA